MTETRVTSSSKEQKGKLCSKKRTRIPGAPKVEVGLGDPRYYTSVTIYVDLKYLTTKRYLN